MTETVEWSDPEPLITIPESARYPIEFLPPIIRKAVEEVQGFMQAPDALIACCALAAVSLAVQGLFNVKRAKKLMSPVSLFLLLIAESGERKTAVDNLFLESVREYERKQEILYRPEWDTFSATETAWQAEKRGIEAEIQRQARKAAVSSEFRDRLKELETTKPRPPKVPRLLYADLTPEALAYGLFKQWPSAGVISSEGGVFFGGHGMGADSIIRNSSLFNQLWDGIDVHVDRKTSESYALRGARLTTYLQVQEPTLRTFLDQSSNGSLLRGIGLWARFLIAWPQSTQGNRFFKDPPENMRSLTAFNNRIKELLNTPVSINGNGELTLKELILSSEAKAVWVKFFNKVEIELRDGGEFASVRDVASKIADNAARLAALFHVFEYGDGEISKDAMKGGVMISRWHLQESLRFFGGLALPQKIVNAAKLEKWLLKFCCEKGTVSLSTGDALQRGPFKPVETLNTVMNTLVIHNRAKIVVDGRKRLIHVNPALLDFNK